MKKFTARVKLRKTSVQTKEPQQNGEEKESFFVKPQLKPVPQREKTPPTKVNILVPHELNFNVFWVYRTISYMICQI